MKIFILQNLNQYKNLYVYDVIIRRNKIIKYLKQFDIIFQCDGV